MPSEPRPVDFLGLGLNSADTLIRLPHFPALDSKVPILSCETLPGGQAAGATVACRRHLTPACPPRGPSPGLR